MDGIGTGYDQEFLGVALPPPDSSAWDDDLVLVDGSPVIDYTHFSLVLSSSRRLCRWVAWNIDKTTLRSGDGDDQLKRVAFRLDRRVPPDAQIGAEHYAANPIDQGHIARRADLLWGATIEEAKASNVDSFHFTNICPQLDDFNRPNLSGVWGLLEDAVLAELKVQQRLTVFGGPVLAPDDHAFDDFRIPRSYWKVVSYVVEGQPRSRAFVLTQSLDRLRSISPLDAFHTFELSLSDLADLVQLGFGDDVHRGAVQTDQGARRAGPPRLISGLGDIDW
ncbi:DNA/RNA non-specific endonuclease [Nocardioides sp.]|uniref:DNA/RNA non-specific endonuclease n=1 Tax=Nocardioides sp. TaxID=35761 RepID=UPI003D0BAFE1